MSRTRQYANNREAKKKSSENYLKKRVNMKRKGSASIGYDRKKKTHATIH